MHSLNLNRNRWQATKVYNSSDANYARWWFLYGQLTSHLPRALRCVKYLLASPWWKNQGPEWNIRLDYKVHPSYVRWEWSQKWPSRTFNNYTLMGAPEATPVCCMQMDVAARTAEQHRGLWDGLLGSGPELLGMGAGDEWRWMLLGKLQHIYTYLYIYIYIVSYVFRYVYMYLEK